MKGTSYTQHTVWSTEDDRYFIEGHVKPERRAIAAANHFARDTCGLVNLIDEKGAELADVTVTYGFIRPDPQFPGDDETGAWCDEDHPQAEAVTVVTPL